MYWGEPRCTDPAAPRRGVMRWALMCLWVIGVLLPWPSVAAQVTAEVTGQASGSTPALSAPSAPASAPAAGARLLRAVRFAPEIDYGPFVYRDADGAIRGLSVDLLGALAPRAGLVIETLPARPLAEQLAAAQRGEVDLISSLRPTPERSAYLRFTPPYIEVPAVVVGRAGQPAVDLDALIGRPVAVGRGYAVEAFVRQRHPAVNWVPVSDDRAGLRLLVGGQVEAVVADVASLAFLGRQPGAMTLGAMHAVGFQYALSFAYRKDWPELGDALAAAIQALPPVERQRVVDRWMPSALPVPDSRVRVLSFVALLAAGVGVVAWWQVRRRASLPVAMPQRERS